MVAFERVRERAVLRRCGMIQAVKRYVVAAVAVALLAGCARPGPGSDDQAYPQPPRSSAPSTEPPTPQATCPPEGVLLQSGLTDGAAGLRALGIDLVNCGHEDYKVDGYPVVRVLDKERKAVAIKVLHGTTEITGPIPDWNGPPNPLTLKPGQQATCIVAWRNTYDDIRRPPVNAPYLEMAPAAGRPSQVMTPDGPLDLGSTGRLGVSPWRISQATTHTTPVAPPPSTQPSLPIPLL
jgi:hypothetical protein